jgi:tetratricopeptide (TPR) repeat protein
MVAGMLQCFYGPLIFADGELHTPSFEVFLDTAAILLVAESARLKSLTIEAAAGFVIGLSALVRPNVLVLLPVGGVWIYYRHKNAGVVPKRLALGATLILCCAMLLPCLVTLRNNAVGRDPVFIASQGGVNLYIGNRAQADGFTPSTPRRYEYSGQYEDSVALFGQRGAEDALHSRLTASQAQRYWLDQSALWWRHHPSDALRLTWKKWVLAWTHVEIRNNLAFDYIRKEWVPFLWACPIGFWLVGPLGLTGMVLGCRRDSSVVLLSAAALAYTFSYVAFFDADRFRLPVVPFLLILSAFALRRICKAVAGRDWRQMRTVLACLVIFGPFVNANWYTVVTPKTWSLDYWSAGNRMTSLGRYDEAAKQYEKALTMDRTNPEIWLNLGYALYNQGQFADAVPCFVQTIEMDSRYASAYYDLGITEEQLKNFPQAKLALQAVLKIDPTRLDAQSELAKIDSIPGHRLEP